MKPAWNEPLHCGLHRNSIVRSKHLVDVRQQNRQKCALSQVHFLMKNTGVEKESATDNFEYNYLRSFEEK
jgi:hypothetical protein